MEYQSDQPGSGRSMERDKSILSCDYRRHGYKSHALRRFNVLIEIERLLLINLEEIVSDWA